MIKKTPRCTALWARKTAPQGDDWPWYADFVGQRQQHNYWTYHIIGETLKSNPQIRGIVEIGTGCGALTMLLGCWARRLNVPIMTWDVAPSQALPVRQVLDALQVQVCVGDCFEHEHSKKIEQFLAEVGPVYLLCDGGNKAKEMAHFGPGLHQGSLISGHDWECELDEGDIQGLLQHGFSRYRPETWTERNVQLVTLHKDFL